MPLDRCIHCLGPVAAGGLICPQCAELLEDLETEPDEPAPEPEPVKPRPAPRSERFEPSAEDWIAYREMAERGSFRPYNSHVAPAYTRGRWGKAMSNWERSQKPKQP